MAAPNNLQTAPNLSRLILKSLLVTLIGSTILLLPDGRGGSILTRSVLAEQIPLASVLPKLESLHEEVKLLLIKNSELRDKILAALQAQNLAKMDLIQAGRLSTMPLQSGTDAGNATMATSSSSSSARPISNSHQQSTNKTNSNNKQEQQHNGAPTMILPQQQQQLANKYNSTGTTSANKPLVSASSLTMKQKSNPGDPSNRSMIDFNELDDFNKWVEMNLEYAFQNTKASAEALKEEAQLNNGTVDYSDQAIKDGLEGIKYWQSAVMFQDKTLKNEKFDSIDERDTNN